MPPKRPRDATTTSVNIDDSHAELLARIAKLEANEQELRHRVFILETRLLAGSMSNPQANETRVDEQQTEEDRNAAEFLDLRSIQGIAPATTTLGPIPMQPPDFPPIASGSKQPAAGNGQPDSKRAKKDPLTGRKIIQKPAKELGKAIRTLMLSELGIQEGDPLPSPPDFVPDNIDPVLASTSSITNNDTVYVPNPLHPQAPPLARPQWALKLTTRANSLWIEHIALTVLKTSLDAYGLLPLHQRAFPPPEFVPMPDLTREKCMRTAKTAFLNYCERWRAQTDPEQRDRKDRNIKKKRRGSRKDQKQRDRIAAFPLSPFTHHPNAQAYEAALTIEAMSSEYSTDGEDGETTISQEWKQKATAVRGDSTGKVLEVRKIDWRSDELMSFLGTLDQLNRNRSTLLGKTQHVASAHPRFSLDAPRITVPPVAGVAQEWMVKPSYRSQVQSFKPGPHPDSIHLQDPTVITSGGDAEMGT